MNITAVREFFCSSNATVLLSYIYDKFDVPEILAAFNANATADWQKVRYYNLESGSASLCSEFLYLFLFLQVYDNVKEIAALINQLIRDAPNVIPPFDPMEFPRITKNIMEGINWNDAEIYLSMSGNLID